MANSKLPSIEPKLTSAERYELQSNVEYLKEHYQHPRVARVLELMWREIETLRHRRTHMAKR